MMATLAVPPRSAPVSRQQPTDGRQYKPAVLQQHPSSADDRTQLAW